MRPRDQQRKKVYDWEGKLLHQPETLSLGDAQKMVRHIAKHYGVKAVYVSDGRGRSSACWDRWSRQIKLPKWARQPAVVLHECAHWIHDVCFDGVQHAAHGREFMAVYLYLLGRYGFDLQKLVGLAREARIDFASVDACRPMHDA